MINCLASVVVGIGDKNVHMRITITIHEICTCA